MEKERTLDFSVENGVAKEWRRWATQDADVNIDRFRMAKLPVRLVNNATKLVDNNFKEKRKLSRFNDNEIELKRKKVLNVRQSESVLERGIVIPETDEKIDDVISNSCPESSDKSEFMSARGIVIPETDEDIDNDEIEERPLLILETNELESSLETHF